MNTETTLAGYIKDGAFCLASLPVFDCIRSLALQLPPTAILESKLAVAFVTGCFLVGARMIEARMTNEWRRRALEAEAKLKAANDR